MPIFHAPLHEIDAKEAKRYAGLAGAKDFDESIVHSACEDALLLAKPQGIWQIYDYDCKAHVVQSDPPFPLEGEKIAKHLAHCEKVIVLSATVGDAIEQEATKRFDEGHYAEGVLLDTAASAAVEQVADGMENDLRPKGASQGYAMRWRFSPGYGDWPLTAQPELVRIIDAAKIGVTLSSSLMLMPRKSITAIIGLYPAEEEEADRAAHVHMPSGCAACSKTDCPSRKA